MTIREWIGIGRVPGIFRRFSVRKGMSAVAVILIAFSFSVVFARPGQSRQVQSLPEEPFSTLKLRQDSVAAMLRDSIPQTSAASADSGRVAFGPVIASDTVGLNGYSQLDEVIVRAVKAAVVAKQDTLEFNAGSFATKPNASVEDLLKKLPGVEVSSDGSITSGGKTVSKILVDGKEFFGDDPKVASKNLPSDMVEKVQVVNRKSEAARLTGVDDGEEETVINLSVKKGMNNGWFGSVGAGYGSDSRYKGNVNVNRFSDGNQFTLLGGINNVNSMGFTDFGGSRFQSYGVGNGINVTRHVGINFNVGNEEKFRVGGNIHYTNTDRTSERRSATQYLFPDSVSHLNSGSSGRNRGHNLRADLRLRWIIDESNTLDFRPRFNLGIRNSAQNDTSTLRSGAAGFPRVYTDNSRRFNRGNSIDASGTLIFNHKFNSRPGRSFSVQMEYSFSDTREKTTSWSDLEYFLKTEDSEILYRYLDSHSWSDYILGRLTYTEPIGSPESGNSLNFTYQASHRWNNADRMTYNVPLPDDPVSFIPGPFTSIPDGATEDGDLSNRFRNRFFDQQLKVAFQKKKKEWSVNAGLMLAPSSIGSEDLIDSRRDIATRWSWNVAPFARFRYRFSKTSSLNLRYNARTSQPSVSQLQPVADVSDPLHITTGNPDLKPSFAQSLSVSYNDFNTDSQRSLVAMLSGSYTFNSVASRTLTDPQTGVRTTSYTNVNGSMSIHGMAMWNQPFRNRAWRLNANLQGMFNSTPGYIDGRFNRSGNLGIEPSAGVTFSADIFQISVNPTYSFGLSSSTLKEQKNRYTHSYGFTADASLDLPFGLSFSTDLDFSQSSGYAAGYNTGQWLWNAQLSYSLLHDRSLTVSVEAYDLLGQKKNISRSVSAASIVDSETNGLRRYVMVSITWKFNTLRKKRTQREGEPPDDGMPPPPPPSGERDRRHAGPPPGPPPGGPM